MFSFFASSSKQNAALCIKESFVFTCLRYKNIQRFQNGLVHEFYGLKPKQMSKVCANSRKYPHDENQEFS